MISVALHRRKKSSTKRTGRSLLDRVRGRGHSGVVTRVLYEDSTRVCGRLGHGASGPRCNLVRKVATLFLATRMAARRCSDPGHGNGSFHRSPASPSLSVDAVAELANYDPGLKLTAATAHLFEVHLVAVWPRCPIRASGGPQASQSAFVGHFFTARSPSP